MHLLSETDTLNRKRKRKPRIKNKFPVKSTFLSEISFLSLLSTLISIKTVSCRHFLSLSPSRLLQQCFSFSTSLLLRSSLSLEPLHLSSVACFFLPTFFRLLSFLLCFSVLKTFYGFASFLSVSQNQTSIITTVSQSNSISFSTSLCLLLSANLKVDSFPSKERTSKRQNLSVHKLAEFPLEVKPQSILYLFKCLRIEFSRRKVST